jgi:hypothetical protein
LSSDSKMYTTQLQAGLGLVEETKLLLSLYEDGSSTSQLYEQALSSGMFPLVSARRLRNIVAECFAPRYVKTGAAAYLQALSERVPSGVMTQLFLYYTCDANRVLADFIREVYWDRYSGGRNTLSTDDARDFVTYAVSEGKTQKIWSDTTVKRVSSYLLGCCADYGLLDSSRGAARSIQPIRVHELTVLYIAYWLHFRDVGDNALLNHECWGLFGLEAFDVKQELKRLARRGWLILQSAGDVTRITWQLGSMGEVIDVITEG